MQEESCCTLENVVALAGNNMKEILTEKISSLKEGDEFHFKADHDFSKLLIEVLQEQCNDLPVKAKFMEDGPSQWIIKVKYPKDGEGCCGCCS